MSVRVDDGVPVIVAVTEEEVDDDRDIKEEAVIEGLIEAERDTVLDTLLLRVTVGDAESVTDRVDDDESVAFALADALVDNDRDGVEVPVEEVLVEAERDTVLDTLWLWLTVGVTDNERVREDIDVFVARALADGELDVDRE